MAKITVLTAVYNAEKYLRQCLDSLKNQTLTDCQFICIDDCSTDASYTILKDYAALDNRFQLLRTPTNSGQAIARNLGLQFARGEYVAMLDADDWLALDALENAYQSLKRTHAQCGLLQLIYYHEANQTETPYPLRSHKKEWSGEEAFYLSLDWSLHGLYVIETDIHKRFPFDTSCRLYSDDNTTRLHYLHATKVVQCKGKYYYRQHPNSMTNACTIRRFDYMKANLSMKRQMEQLPLNSKQKILNFYEKHRWLNIVGCYWFYYQHKGIFTEKEHREIESIFSQMLLTIERHRLPWNLKLKLGYYPFYNFRLFCLAENFYFKLRRIFGRKVAT